MSDFINTVDIVDDDVLIDSLIEKTFSGSFNDNKITGIRYHAFSYCTNLESVCFPKVTSIGGGAFRGSGLKAITAETFPLVTKIEYMYTSYVFGESALETVYWPSIQLINDGRFFADCKSLRSVDLPNLNSLGNYGSNMFTNDTSLTDVNLPLVPACPDFSGCTALQTIALPSAQSINGGMFSGCTSLRIVDMPACIKMTGHSHFINCPLDAFILRGPTMCACSLYTIDPSHTLYSFKNSGIANGTGYIYVPRDLVDSYKTDTNWSHLANQFRALEDYTVDGTTTGALDETKI